MTNKKPKGEKMIRAVCWVSKEVETFIWNPVYKTWNCEKHNSILSDSKGKAIK